MRVIFLPSDYLSWKCYFELIRSANAFVLKRKSNTPKTTGAIGIETAPSTGFNGGKFRFGWGLSLAGFSALAL